MSYLSMAEMTSPRFAALDEGHAIGLISASATEQHGPHLPLATDTIIVTRLVHEIASRIAIPVVVAPPLPIGISQHHLGFAGTVHVRDQAFAECMRAYVRAMRDGGVRQVALISSHGGNFACLGKVAAEYASDPDVSVIAFDDLPRYATIMAAAAAAAGLAVPGSDIHAGGLETSQMLHLWRPDDIPMDPPPRGTSTRSPGGSTGCSPTASAPSVKQGSWGGRQARARTSAARSATRWPTSSPRGSPRPSRPTRIRSATPSWRAEGWGSSTTRSCSSPAVRAAWAARSPSRSPVRARTC